MKKNILLTIAATALVLISLAGSAQEEQQQISNPKAKCVSDKGFWVVEGNVHNALEHTIHFYNNNKVDIYKETVSGVKLKLNKRKTLMQMKSVLESAVIAWEQNQPLNENGKYFVAAIQKR